VFNIRMALECKGQVFPLHFSRLEHGVAYFQLADGRMQIQRESQGSGLVEAVGGQPVDTKALSPGAEEGEEAAQPDKDRAHAATPGEPVTGDLAPSPPAIGQAIMAAEPAPQRRAKAPAKQRPWR
jgi:hypothetical protein